MDRKKLIVYAGIPAAISAVLMGMYFSGVRILETIAAMPYLESIPPNSRRELGLIENLQNVFLLAIIVIALRAAFRTRSLFERGVFAMIALVTTFLFLEEIDYGLHYYELIAGVPAGQETEVRNLNLHNVGNRTVHLKQIADVFMVAVFVIAPWPLRRSTNLWLRFLAPDPYLALTLIVGILTRTVAHSLNSHGYGVGIRSNISEFREVVTYYLALLYALELSRRITTAPTPVPPRADQATPQAL